MRRNRADAGIKGTTGTAALSNALGLADEVVTLLLQLVPEVRSSGQEGEEISGEEALLIRSR